MIIMLNYINVLHSFQNWSVFCEQVRKPLCEISMSLDNTRIQGYFDPYSPCVTSRPATHNQWELMRTIFSFAGLWAVVNNAGVGGAKQPLEWTTRDEFIATLEVNLYGVVFVSKAFLPLIRREKGRIVNMASAAGRLAAVSPDYCVSKYGVEAFSDAMRYVILRLTIYV